jgi:outer membrane protein OmpA-like peptidoglycan-associated protein/tetratricopeptide (TPR) repeat protein
MHYILRSLTLVILLSISLNAIAQKRNYDAYSSKNRKKLAQATLKAGSPYSAIEHYKALTLKDPQNADLALDLGNAYLVARDYGKAADCFRNAVSLDKKGKLPANFKLGQALKYQGKYSEAKQAFIDFTKQNVPSSGKINYKTAVNEELQGIEQAMALMQLAPIEGKIVNEAEVNIPYSDFAPNYAADSSLIFASLRQDSVIYLEEEEVNTYFVKLYSATKGEAVFQNPQKMGDYDFGAEHSANGAYNAEKTRFYFNRCETNSQGKTICELYVVSSEGDNAGKAELVKAAGKGSFTTTQPTVGAILVKGKPVEVVYFSSNRPSGVGGFDIWYLTYDPATKKYGKVTNAGKSINTKYDEITPYYHQLTNRLYYASNTVMGLGGYDFFFAEGEENKFSIGANLGYPLNSSTDDQYIVVGANDKKGFLVSNRPGGKALLSPTCCDDIYNFELVKPLKEVTKAQQQIAKQTEDVITVDSSAFAQNTNSEEGSDNSEGANDSESIGSKKPIRKKLTAKEKRVEAGVKRWKDKSKGGKKGINAGTPDNEVVNTAKEKITPSNEIKIEEFVQTQEKPIMEIDILYDFNKDILKPMYFSKIQAFLKVAAQHPEAKISIEAHTDSVGTTSYNVDLAERRAVSVVRYLLTNDTPEELLLSRSFGENRPRASNTNADGTDNAAGRALNRRVTMVLIK